MSPHEWIVLATIVGALILFISEKLSIDLVALLILMVLVGTGVITPKEALNGFSDQATITVAFMFVLSAALLRTGAVSTIGPKLSVLFRTNPLAGMLVFTLVVACLSAFVNNTPVVALLMPVVVQMAHSSGQAPSKLLIPLSYATIVGGVVTLLGTSTNIVVSGVLTTLGMAGLGMFDQTPLGLIFMVVGVLYLGFIGRRLLPDRRQAKDLGDKFSMRGYVTEIQILKGAQAVGQSIMDSSLVKELDMDIIEIRRADQRFTLPSGDMILEEGDILKVRCELDRIRALKDRAHISVEPTLRLANDDLRKRGTTLVELVITASSELEGKLLGEADLIRKYRAVPLAVRHREDVVHERLHDVVLRAGDVILAEVRSHYVATLKKLEGTQESPFVILTEQEGVAIFQRKRFAVVSLVLLAVVILSSTELVPIAIATLGAVVLLVLLRMLSMKDVYESIEWRIVFLLAGTLSLGVAMQKCGLADRFASGLVEVMGPFGPRWVICGLYLITLILTELMSNTATAALVTPIAVATAHTLGVSPMPFVMAVVFAASLGFMTPFGYQTNAMIYGVGQYKSTDFLRVGAPLSILFWVLATWLIPEFYPF
ncbi:MAG: SLC13 family permease [Flavobacteriales bacterium]|nr:SLC13 family permease [Flavobacteriales bacterium]